MRGFYGARWELGPTREAFNVLVADDFVISPPHRDRGLATLIMKAAFEDLAKKGYKHVFNLSGGRVTMMNSLAMGWKSAGFLEPIGLPIGPTACRRMLDRLKQKLPFPKCAGRPILDSAAERQPFARLDRVSRLRVDSSIALDREPRSDAMSELVGRLGHDGRIRHIRDREFFAWRFRNPLRIYRFLYLGRTELDGYLVLKCAHPGALETQKVEIVDLEAAHPALGTKLLDAVIQSGGFSQLFAWAVTFSNDTRRYLSARGFKPVDPDSRAHGFPGVLVRPVVPGAVDSDWVLGDRRLNDLANWDMRMLYTMAA